MDTIAITSPKIKVNTKIKDLTFDSIEDMIFEISKNIAVGYLKSYYRYRWLPV